jgi:hypothetical protein
MLTNRRAVVAIVGREAIARIEAKMVASASEAAVPTVTAAETT